MDYIRNPSGSKNAARQKNQESVLSNRRIIDTDLETLAAPEQSTLGKSKLVNILNLRHFRNETVRLNFLHSETGRKLVFEAFPQPCFGKYLVCLWANPPSSPERLEKYSLTGLSFSRGFEYIHAEAGIRATSKKGICLVLAEKASIQSLRLSTRHECRSVQARLMQHGAVFAGRLKDFNASAFCVALNLSSECPPIQWLNTNTSVTLLLESENSVIYSGECRIFKTSSKRNEKLLVLEPVNDTIQRFEPRQYRSRRVSVFPSPDIVFYHPLTGNMVNLKAVDISGAGISVEESRENSVMVAGLILPDITINFANAFNIRCKAQVAYTRTVGSEQNQERIKCGITFLDMDPAEHVRLMSMIQQTENSHSYICSPVDFDSLWEFFFETGFIYPKKYAFIQPYKEELKETYKKLYACQSTVARHFTWQQDGVIVAHLSMLRFYEKTWLIQHLAARTEKRFNTGIEMVDQIASFAYETHRLASSRMSYLICYYRPSNRFPAHFFGGAAEKINNAGACSVDDFAYYHTRLVTKTGTGLSGNWSLSKAGYEELCELRDFYDRQSGGRMINALDLVAEETVRTRSDLSDRYHEMGLHRERRVFALKHRNDTKAVIMANVSDVSLNLSDLTNCINVFVIDGNTPYESVQQAVSMMGQYYESAKIPVLIYPLSYVKNTGAAYDRVYCLWAMDMQYTDDFFRIYNSLK